VRIASIIRVMKAVHTSQTLAYSNETTQHYIPEGSNLPAHCRENQKSHEVEIYHSKGAVICWWFRKFFKISGTRNFILYI